MALVKNGQRDDDIWITLGEEGTFFPGTATIVPLARWEGLKAAAYAHDAPIGVRVAPGEDVSQLRDDLARLALIAIEFPAFKDGRGFSSARLLRERYGFTGELRAVGHVIRDQFLYLHRCGFDAVELDDRNTEEDWHGALTEFSVWYQPTGDGRDTVNALRARSRSIASAAE